MLYTVFGQSLEESERNSIHTWIMNVPFRVDPIMTSEVDWEDAQSDEEGEYVGDSTRCTILQLLFVLFHNVCLWAWVTGGIEGDLYLQDQSNQRRRTKKISRPLWVGRSTPPLPTKGLRGIPVQGVVSAIFTS